MSANVDGGMDEPTVVGRRPIGRGRAAPPPARFGEPAEELTAPARTPIDRSAAEPNRPARTPALRARETAQTARAASAPDAPQNPDDALVAAATPLLIVIAHLRNAVQQADVAALRKEMADQTRAFEERATRFGARVGDISAARYALCSFVDEAVMTTPWGSASSWSANSLLLEFHQETWGGEKVYAMIDRVRAEPQKYLALLKLLDTCLLLGFEGKYRVVDNGRERLTELRADLGRLMRQHARQPPTELSSSWRGVSATKRLRNYVPLWVVFALAGAVVVSSYGLVKWRVASETAPAENALKMVAGPT
ncbi:MAG: type IVB secretion system protein IcmH/DotU [Hyphomicrobiales bacterium]|nr:type IVB secretion system protein IcmH/DotU [Hyphomicrobiales bacterium]MBV8663157.1 type IVB secretion system protein IcmH/DotU [Hyphomicrobiales bacterium]